MSQNEQPYPEVVGTYFHLNLIGATGDYVLVTAIVVYRVLGVYRAAYGDCIALPSQANSEVQTAAHIKALAEMHLDVFGDK